MTKTKVKIDHNDEAMVTRISNLAYRLAEKRIVEGTASSQIIIHFLKIKATEREIALETKKLEQELIKAKIKAMESSQSNEESMDKVLSAIKSYLPNGVELDEY